MQKGKYRSKGITKIGTNKGYFLPMNSEEVSRKIVDGSESSAHDELGTLAS